MNDDSTSTDTTTIAVAFKGMKYYKLCQREIKSKENPDS